MDADPADTGKHDLEYSALVDVSGIPFDELVASTNAALARALLALGGTLAVLEDAGDPAHVRNDFRGAYMSDGGSSVFDRGSPFERYVAETFGQAGVPAAAKP